MRYTEPNQPEEITTAVTTEERLRREVEDLKRQLREQKNLTQGASAAGAGHGAALRKPWNPSALTIWSLFLGAVVLIVVAKNECARHYRSCSAKASQLASTT